MKIIKDNNQLIIKHPKVDIAVYFAQLLAYTAGLILVCFVIWSSGSMKIGVRVFLVCVVIFFYVLITIRQKKFKIIHSVLQLVNNQIIINGEPTGFSKIDSIILFNCLVTTEAMTTYYDIDIGVGNKKYHIIDGVYEDDVKKLVKALNNFNGSEVQVISKD